MATPSVDSNHIEVTETLLRLYVFLSNYLDRCVNEAARQTYPEAQLQAHLAETVQKLREILAVNRVVHAKVEQECDRVIALGAACLKAGGQGVMAEDVKAARAVLQNKMIALSDLLAVFRSV
ncbi:hypothetical protein [Candidatus Nitrospira bockiana]